MNVSDETFSGPIFQETATQFGQVYFLYQIEENYFHYINPAFQKVWLENQERFQQEPADLLAFIYPGDQAFVEQEYKKLVLLQQPASIEFRIILANQIIKWISVYGHVIRKPEQNKRFISGFAHDITEKKAYLDNILKFNTKKDSTLEILSHDLASPFANIEGLIHVLEEQITAGEKDVKQLIAFIKEDAKRGSDLIRDFVHNEFLESSQISINKVRVDIAHKIAAMMDSYKKGLALIPKHFKFVPSKMPIFMYVDEMKFMQVLNNLISNAIKFTPDNGIITVLLQEKDTTIFITVADNGIGIPELLQSSLFDKFTKARRPGIRGEKSVGLGMSIIKNIIELHKGKIRFDSQENVGTTFYIEMPKE